MDGTPPRRNPHRALSWRPHILALLGAISVAPVQSQDLFTLTGSIPLPGVEGRIDHLAIDLPGRRVFVAAFGNDSLEVVDLRSSSVIHRILGLSEPQGVAFVEESNKLYVANAGTGACDVYDARSFALWKRIDLGGDADNMHYAAASRQLVVSAGNGLSVIDTTSDTVIGRVDLPGHPEGFALQQNGPKVFANVPSSRGRLFVVDRERDATVDQWPVGALFTNLFSNFPLALDQAGTLLFVGTRRPARLKVMSTGGGRVLADIGIDGDPDDVFYDGTRGMVYVSCGAGFVDVVPLRAPDRYGPVDRIPTAQGARTSLWVPEMDRLYVAVPHRGAQRAELLVYQPRVP